MKQIDKIKMLTEMLFENIELLEEYPARVKEWEEEKENFCKGNEEKWLWFKPYPSQGTSDTHIKDIARLLRKELLKL